MASEASSLAITVNMHMDIRGKEVAGFKSKVIFIEPLLSCSQLKSQNLTQVNV